MAPLVRGLTGAAHDDAATTTAPRPGAQDAAAARVGDAEPGDRATHDQPQAMSTSMTSESTTAAADDELPEPGTTRNLLAKFQSLQTATAATATGH